jgi:hypothetical protein
MKSFYLVSVRHARGFRSNLFGFACTFAGYFKANFRAEKEHMNRYLGPRFRFAAPRRKRILNDRFNTSGPLSELQIGPSARNIAGARHSGRRITAAFNKESIPRKEI